MDVIVPVTVLDQLVPDFIAYRWDLDVYFYLFDHSGTSWHWDFGDGATDSVLDPIHTYAAYGNYTVTLTVSNGLCDTTISQVVYVDGTRNLDPEQIIDIQLFPNPGNGLLTITAEPASASNFQLAVYDIHGKRLYQSSPLYGPRFEKEVNLSKHGAGLYFIHLQVDDVQLSRKYVLIK